VSPASLLSIVLLGFAADEPTIEWAGNEACPGAEAELDRGLQLHLGLAPEPEPVQVQLRLADAGPAGLRLELRLESRAGSETHELVAWDCEQLLDHAALLIAGVVDPFLFTWDEPNAAQRHHRDVPIQRPSEQAGAAPLIEARVDTLLAEDVAPFGPLEFIEPNLVRSRSVGDDVSASRSPISGAISVGPTAFVGLFPQVGGGFELEGALERGSLRWHNGLSGWFGGRVRSSEAEVGADLWALGLSTALCGVPAGARVRVPLCAVGGAGLVRARAVGTIEARSTSQPWAWAGAEARLLVLVRDDLALGLGVGAHAILVRPAWEIRAPDVRFVLPPVMGVLRLTLEVRELRRGKPTGSAINAVARGH
jgi:hypothetical protein